MRSGFLGPWPGEQWRARTFVSRQKDPWKLKGPQPFLRFSKDGRRPSSPPWAYNLIFHDPCSPSKSRQLSATSGLQGNSGYMQRPGFRSRMRFGLRCVKWARGARVAGN
ncbi:hypothetical protein PoB_007487100 [Plakobranchus ocellatus]|uniref:Uncharacterized protein n=1 Tax=Plakobranchus ocellatus TaxID=259542 RepID=A0AAV4DW58_9GAST|nr:hypothetical protein PoB_007487100 [Plakobranchus ocellatus]